MLESFTRRTRSRRYAITWVATFLLLTTAVCNTGLAPTAHAAPDYAKIIEQRETYCREKGYNAIAGWYKGKEVEAFAYKFSGEEFANYHARRKLDGFDCVSEGKLHKKGRYSFQRNGELGSWYPSSSGTYEYFYQELDADGKPTSLYLRGGEFHRIPKQ
ncbi:hypothetical protein ACWDYH_35460 [Nocardia goodfellowii]